MSEVVGRPGFTVFALLLAVGSFVVGWPWLFDAHGPLDVVISLALIVNSVCLAVLARRLIRHQGQAGRNAARVARRVIVVVGVLAAPGLFSSDERLTRTAALSVSAALGAAFEGWRRRRYG